jgi:hypothetical protein
MPIARTGSRIEAQSPAIHIPRPPMLRPWQFLAKAIKAHAAAVSMCFGAAMGIRQDAPTRQGSPPDPDSETRA